MKLSEIKKSDKKIAIHCQTEAEANAYCKIMHDAGEKWYNGRSYLSENNYFNLKENTCYLPYCGKYGKVSYYLNEQDYTIIPAIDFIRANETHKESLKRKGLKVGDRVRVLCKSKDLERGWGFYWSNGMTLYLGEVGSITDINDKGVRIDGKYSFPAFVLEKVEEEKKEVVFTSHDGVDIRHGDKYYYINHVSGSICTCICKNGDKYDNVKYPKFSTKEAAEAHLTTLKLNNMQKEVLVAFDYERAKSKPTLVRFEHSGKPHDITFTANGLVVSYEDRDFLYNKIGISVYSKEERLMLVDDEPATIWFNNIYDYYIGRTAADTLDECIKGADLDESPIAVQKTTVKGKKIAVDIVHYY